MYVCFLEILDTPCATSKSKQASTQLLAVLSIRLQSLLIMSELQAYLRYLPLSLVFLAMKHPQWRLLNGTNTGWLWPCYGHGSGATRRANAKPRRLDFSGSMAFVKVISRRKTVLIPKVLKVTSDDLPCPAVTTRFNGLVFTGKS